MKRTLMIGLIGLALIGAIASLAPGQTAKEVLDKMIESQGGRKALSAVKDATLSGSLEMNIMGMSMSGTIVIYQKEPNKMRMDMEFSVQGMAMAITQACDGEKAWATEPQSGSVRSLSGKELEDMKKQAFGNEATLNPEKFGISFAFKGKEKIETKDYLVLDQIYKDGQKVIMYVDPATYLIFKTKGPGTDPQTGAEVEAETFYSDYKKVGDITMASGMSVHQAGAEFLRMTFAKITLNTGLDDALFSLAK